MKGTNLTVEGTANMTVTGGIVKLIHNGLDMGASASVIQEYYKAVDYWADIAGKKDWKLAIWIVGRNDVDLVDQVSGDRAFPCRTVR